ncbi:hypothetical protein O71_04096 [Pontibacter sp. BAB1700]|nr:hypothetical protein [Pontibacter sp. BAB1700]EJF11280.1 hypothetical protein O71_04096 [Pontibacter sp. BAB1700]
MGKGAVGAGEVLHVQLIAPIYDIGFDGKHQVRVHTIVGYEDLYTFGGLGVTAVDRYTAKRKSGQYVEYGHQASPARNARKPLPVFRQNRYIAIGTHIKSLMSGTENKPKPAC